MKDQQELQDRIAELEQENESLKKSLGTLKRNQEIQEDVYDGQRAMLAKVQSELQDTLKRLVEQNEKYRIAALSLESSNTRLIEANAQLKREIEERETIEAALLQSEERFRLLVDSIPVLIHAHDEDKLYCYWNKESEAATGYSAKDMIGKPSAFCPLHLKQQDTVGEEIQELTRKGGYRGLETKIVCADGSEKIISWSNVSDKCPLPGWSSWETGLDVTKEKLVLAKLMESEERWRRILEFFPQGVILHRDGECLYANPSALRLLQIDDEEKMVGKILPDFFNREGFLQESETSKIVNDGTEYTEHYVSELDEYFSLVSTEIIFQGRPTILSVLKDITDRKRYEKEIVESRNIVRALIDSTEDFSILVDMEYRIVACNKSWSKSVNKHPREVIGTTLSSHLDKEPIWNDIVICVQRSIASMEVVFFVAFYKERLYDCRVYPIFESSKNITHLAISAHDITILAQAQKAQQESELLYRTIFERAGDMLFIHDHQGRILAMNQKMVDLLGYSTKNVPDLAVTDIFTPATGQKDIIWEETDACYLQVYVKSKDGVTIPLDINACSIRYKGEPAYLCIGRDVTEWKNATSLLKHAKEEAENNIRIKNEFLANISHELRTPLSSIIGIAQIMSLGRLDVVQRGFLGKLRNSSNHLMNLINDLLDISKLEAGVFKLEKHEFNFLEFMAELKGTFVDQALHKDIDFSYTISESVPEVLLGDHLRLKQIIFNIVSNAIKYTHKGSISVSISLKPDDEPDDEPGKINLYFVVTDTGIGIDSKEFEKIFNRFYQAGQKMNAATRGVGLGLAISKQLCELMGGKIWVESQIGKGSAFHIIIPFESPPRKLAEAFHECPGKHDLTTKSMQILVVEDNVINRDMIKVMLEMEGHIVRTADDGLQALESLKAFVPEVILMDLQMPNLDGIEATKRIRSHGDPRVAAVPIIAMSAYSHKEFEQISRDAGMNKFLVKPLLMETLHSAIANIDIDVATLTEEESEDQNEENLNVINLPLLKANLNNDEDLVKIACSKFLVHSKCFTKNIQDAVGKEDASLVKRLSHSFKSVTAMFGAGTAQQLVIEIERGVQKNDWKTLQSKTATLIQEVGKIQSMARKIAEM